MTPQKDVVYEFGEFVYDPRFRVLTQFDKSIELAGKSADILEYLLKRPKEMVSGTELIQNVWGEESPVHESNVPTQIAKIRKALGCDSNHPTFIKTYHGRSSYRFIAEVNEVERDSNKSAPDNTSPTMFEITSHLFVPIYSGRNVYQTLSAAVKEGPWTNYKEFRIDAGRLCLLPGGMAVWHLVEKHRFETISDIARWRKNVYDKILYGEHRIAHHAGLYSSLNEEEKTVFGQVWRRPSYVFSLMVLDRSPLKNEAQLTKLLEILSCLRPLEDAIENRRGAQDGEKHGVLERSTSNESTALGSPGEDIGFASWDSVSYHCNSDNTDATDKIVELEIAVQATWWLAKCLNSSLIGGEAEEADISKPMSDLTRQYARLQVIGENETPAVRRMVEAVLATSRIDKLVNETFRLYENLRRFR